MRKAHARWSFGPALRMRPRAATTSAPRRTIQRRRAAPETVARRPPRELRKHSRTTCCRLTLQLGVGEARLLCFCGSNDRLPHDVLKDAEG